MINGFKKTNFIIVFILFFCFNAFSQATQYRLGISSDIYSNKEQFEFSLGNGQKLLMKSTNKFDYFTTTFVAGQTYSITQTAGPRPCSFFQNKNQGTFVDREIVVSISCGRPPLSSFKLQTIGIEQGETFKFGSNYGSGIVMSFSGLVNLGSFPIGDDYTITQTDGPRQCRMTNNQGVVPTANITVIADCTKPSVGNPTQPPTAGSYPEIDFVSRSTDDKSFGTFYDSTAPVIGGKGEDEGRYVAFVSYAVGLGGSKGKFRQIIWRDRKTGETRIVSSSAANGEGNQNSFAPAISADGKSVAFESYATNLVPIDTNGVRDVFVWNYDRNTISAVSDAPGGIEANSEAFEPTISGDGRFIAFSSSASTLTPGVYGTSTVNVFLKDMQSGQVTLISKSEKDGKGGGGSRPSISEDGSRIAFYNYFPLTKDDLNNLWDIYVWQSGMPKLKRITKTASGGEKNQGDESSSRVVSPTISGNGRFVSFATTATNMVSGDTKNFQNAYLAEVDSGRITLLSSANGTLGNADTPFSQGEKISLTFDGRMAVFSTKALNLGGRLILGDYIEGSTLNSIVPLKIDGVETSISVPAISRTGKCVVFGSNKKLDKNYSSSGIFVFCR